MQATHKKRADRKESVPHFTKTQVTVSVKLGDRDLFYNERQLKFHMLSVYDGDQITAANAFAHYTQTLKLESSGVMAVSVTECNELALPVRPDPAPLPRTCPDRLFLLQQERHRKENQTAQGKSSKTQLALPENVRMNTRKSGCTGQGILGGA